MTKKDLISEVARRTGLTREEAMSSLESVMEIITESLSKGETVNLRGFGNFVVKSRKEKMARNIAMNTVIKIPAHNVPIFKAADALLSKVKNKALE